MGEDRTGATTGGDRRRLTVPEAAEALGVTVDAVRGRIRRGKLASEHDGGAVYVWLDAPEDAAGRGPSQTSRGPSGDWSEGHLVEDLREQVAYLREQLDREREARTEERRRQDTIIAQLSAANMEQARTIRAIEAPQEAPGDAETVEEEPEASEPRPATGGAQEGAQRPWWRRVFGG
jgi:hypothetical protein